MKVSLVISVYKNTKDLKVVLDALAYQTVLADEIIISEDGDSEEMRLFLKQYSTALNIVHLTQSDLGWQKNKALNNAIRNAKNDYLIFIDGDCVLHHRFIESHIAFAESDKILAGKRVKLGPLFSEKLRNTNLLKFEKHFVLNTFAVFKDGVKFFEEALYFSPDSFLGKLAKKRTMRWLKGCNFSCYKDALITINGFDEDYKLPAIGEDIDLVWRFNGLGYQLKSIRNFAVQYHLHHKENWVSQEENIAIMEGKQQMNLFVCENGLQKLNKSAL
jgi:GT2 family glycosyltransferase